MRIRLITPASPSARNGNRFTALRWALILKRLGHRVTAVQHYEGGDCDLMIALHARRSFDSIRRFHDEHPDLPLIVALTGTDRYRDIRTNARARESLELATRLVVLQAKAMADLPQPLHAKTRVIYQSAAPVNGRPPAAKDGFQVCVVGHLRPEKDPLRTPMAARDLPSWSRVRVLHIGRALTDDMQKRAHAEATRNPRYCWVGELPHWKTRRILAASHLLSVTSRMEGSSNVLSEAIVSSVPAVVSKIPGLIGTLGENYPGYFPVGDTQALTRLLLRAETDVKFYRALKSHCASLRGLVDPAREKTAWKKLLDELR
ncbi:MAG: TIGR04348 family glycosyltransferase [Deltaproteobacteria bacterium]|nr:TIGR04348 family glycosyltransferase [Deltaproteobacteria bacterium]